MGCRLHGIFLSCILYVDDILLVSGSLIKLKLMLNLCFDFGYENDLVYKAKNSVFCFGELFKFVAELKCLLEKKK